MTCIRCIHCGKAVTNALPSTAVFRATATCPECEEKLPDAEMLQAQVTQLTDELTKARRDIASISTAFDAACDQRENLHAQLADLKARHQRYVERAKQLLRLVGDDGDLDEDAQWKHL